MALLHSGMWPTPGFNKEMHVECLFQDGGPCWANLFQFIVHLRAHYKPRQGFG